MWEESLCSSAREREKRNMKCFPAAIKPLPAGHLLLLVIEGCRQMSSSEPNLRWHQPGVLGITPGPDVIASTATRWEGVV